MTKDKRNKIVLDNMKLVYYFARLMTKWNTNEFSDVASEGTLGLIYAVDNFIDSYSEEEKQGYMSICIRGYMLKYLEKAQEIRKYEIPQDSLEKFPDMSKSSRIFYEMISDLKGMDQVLLIERFIENLTNKEMAKKRGITENALCKRIKRLFIKLQNQN